MAYSLEQIFHTEPKIIGMIEIYSNPMDRKTVQEIEKVIKEIAKSMHINLNNIPSGDTLRVYIYPTRRIFYSFFSSEIESNVRRKRSRTMEDMLFVVGEGEIHMVSPKATGSSYANMIKILVKDVLSEYGLDSKVKKAQEKVSEELEPKDETLEEPEENQEDLEELDIDDEIVDEDEIEELDEDELVDTLEEIDLQIERAKEENQTNIPEWFDLGWIMYKRQILASTKNREDFASFITKKGVVSKGKISGKQSVVGEYNYANESAAAIIEYIVENYGIRRIFDLASEPDIQKVLKISEARFKRESTAWIKKRYVASKVKELNDESEKEDIESNIKEKSEK